MTDVVLHIGSGKTGTSSLQEWCGRNRGVLADHGVLYPRSPGRYRHVLLGLMVTPDEDLPAMPAWRRMGREDPAAFRTEVRDGVLAEVREAGLGRVLFSNEGFFGGSEAMLRRVRGFLDALGATDAGGGRARVVVYLRRQDDHLLSRYQQRIKVGATERLVSRLDVDLRHVYDYAARLDLWRRVVTPDELVVRPFEREQFPGGSLQQDFLDACGIPLAESTLEPVERANESLDAEAVEFLRILNLWRVEHEGAVPMQIDNRALVARLAARGKGPTLGLPDDLLDAFLARWTDANAAVARTWLDRPDGVLFRSARRSADVVTEQRLDPARLPDLLDLAEVPRRSRAVVRRIAEREAGAGRPPRRGLLSRLRRGGPVAPTA